MNTYLTWAWETSLALTIGLIITYILWDIRVRSEKISRRSKVLMWRVTRTFEDESVERVRVIERVEVPELTVVRNG